VIFERSQERGRIGHPAEQRLDHEQTCLVVAACEVAPDWLAGTVAQQQAAIVAVERVSQGGIDANTRRAAGEDGRFGAMLAQDGLQLCLEEAAVAVLRDDNVALFRGELGQNLCPPSSLDERPAFATAGRRNDVADAQQLVLQEVGRIRRPGIRKIRSNCIVR